MPDERPAPIEPPVLDRAGLERVLARAAELQSAVGDAPEALSEEQLLDVGREVGIAPEHLRQAIAEERGRGLLPPESGLAVMFAGSSMVAAARVVPGSPSSVLAALDATMQRDEVLILKRRFPERLIWEAQRGFIGGLRRGFALSGRSYHLESASDVAAGVAAVDAGRVHVRLNASFHEVRGRRLGIAATATGLLALSGVAAVVMGVMPLVAAALPAAIATAALAITRRDYRRTLARAQVALEQILDRLEYGAPKSSPAQSLLDAFIGTPRLPK